MQINCSRVVSDGRTVPNFRRGSRTEWSPATSEFGLPSGTDIRRWAYDFGFAPGADIGPSRGARLRSGFEPTSTRDR